MPNLPLGPIYHPSPLNDTPPVTYDSLTLLQFCDCSDFCTVMHRGGMGLGRKPLSRSSGLLSAAANERLEQTFNTLDQGPCTVVAYLESTCSGGCECSLCVNGLSASVSYLQCLLSIPFSPDTSTSAQAALMIPIYASATPFPIPSLVHVLHAREDYGRRTFHYFHFPNPPRISH
jgi:hypothetical protein